MMRATPSWRRMKPSRGRVSAVARVSPRFKDQLHFLEESRSAVWNNESKPDGECCRTNQTDYRDQRGRNPFAVGSLRLAFG
jgi:hypothetical protein